MGSGGAGANGSGGGIYNGKNMDVRGCTFAFNSAQGGSSAAGGNQANGTGATGAAGADGTGGAVWSTWWGLMTNCTIYNNNATGGNGGNGGNGSGAISTAGNGGDGGSGWGGGLFNSGTLTVVNCTVSSGSAVAGTNGAAGNGTFSGSPGQMGHSLGGNIASSGGTFNLGNSILATNLSGGNGFGTITDLGHDLSSDTSIPLPGAGSAVNIDPKLGPLALNGGPTATMMLLAGSPATNQIPAGAAPKIDQRGYPRPLPPGGLSDIGAVEYELGYAPVIVQFPTNQTIIQGGSATFQITAIGATPLAYQWHLNGTNIPGATQSAYTISNASATNAGADNFYDVLVRNSVNPSTNSGPVYAFLGLVPTILGWPSNQVAQLGGSATFSVQADGSSPLYYQWQFHNTNIAGATATSLTISNVQGANAGVYFVLITNLFGSTNAPARLDVPPQIVSQPTNRAVNVGATTVFAVGATGSTPLSYQWQFNGANIAGAINATLSLTNVDMPNIGSYLVVVTNTQGSVTSATASLNLLPTIQGQPTNLTVTAGNPAAFYITAAGSPTLSYQWRLNGASLPGVTNSSYTIAHVQTPNLGTYTVFITNLFGSITSAPATLSFGLAPSITTQPDSPPVSAGSTAVLTVIAAGTSPLSYQWRLIGTNLLAASNASLSITNAQVTNSGPYTVFITNAFGNATSAPAIVKLLPTLIAQPTNQIVATGSTGSFNVTATGTAPLTYQWKFYGSNAPPPSTDSAYQVPNAHTNNVGPYTVVIVNPYGSITSAPALLSLGVIPSIVGQPTNQIVRAGSNATFSVTARGTQPLIYQWQFSSTNIPNATASAFTS
jgi:hypothetical protein